MDLKISSTERKRILGNVRTVLEVIPKTSINSLQQMLDGGIDITASNVKKFTGLSGEALDSIIFLFDNKNVPRDVLALALNVALESEEHARKGIETIDMSWTGPIQFSVEGRSNISVVEEMIRNANDTITIVGYSLTKDAKKIIALLEDAIKDNVEILFVIHSDDKSDNIETLKKIWKHYKRPKIYTREPAETDVYFKIHAKMLVVDSRDILVTSANLTWHGMSNNFELGLRVRGKTAEKGQTLITELIRRKYLKEVIW